MKDYGHLKEKDGSAHPVSDTLGPSSICRRLGGLPRAIDRAKQRRGRLESGRPVVDLSDYWRVILPVVSRVTFTQRSLKLGFGHALKLGFGRL